MSGKPQFDDSAVINSAMEVFWRHGYAAVVDQRTDDGDGSVAIQHVQALSGQGRTVSRSAFGAMRSAS